MVGAVVLISVIKSQFGPQNTQTVDTNAGVTTTVVVATQPAANQPSATQVATARPTVAVVPQTNNPDISDEQDFDAVSSRETIAWTRSRRSLAESPSAPEALAAVELQDLDVLGQRYQFHVPSCDQRIYVL